jgi:hypothetical protein
MTQLKQASSSIGNSGLFTFSGWFRSASLTPPVGSLQGQTFGYLDLFAAGNLNTGPFAPDAFYTGISVKPGGMLISLCGPQGTYTGTAAPFGRLALYGVWSALNAGLAAPGIGITGLTDCQHSILNITFGANFPRAASIELNTWHHLFVSADTTGGGSLISDVPPNPNIVINNKYYVFLDGVDVLGNTLGAPTASQNGLSIGYDDPGNPIPETITIPPYSLRFSGQEMSVPSLTAMINDSPEMERAHTQIWFDRCIVPTAGNLAKFIRTDQTTNQIFPVGGRVAADFFAVPAVWLERDSVSGVFYQDNNGGGGVFTVVGTPPTDFTPSPSDPIGE